MRSSLSDWRARSQARSAARLLADKIIMLEILKYRDMSSGNTQAIVQHITMIAARLQALSATVEKMAGQIEELKAGAGSSAKPTDIADLKDELKKDIIRERAMLEASLEHRIDQQINRSVVENDQTASIAALNKRIDAIAAKVDAAQA